MQLLSLSILNDLFDKGKETALSGRWIRLKEIEPILLNHQKKMEVAQIGFSEQQRPIYQSRYWKKEDSYLESNAWK